MRLATWLVLPPLALATVFLAVANRHHVLFGLDPFDPETPALALEAPLFVIVLAAMFVGILIGGLSVRFGRAGRRRAAAARAAPKAAETATGQPTAAALPLAPPPDRIAS